MKEKRSIKIHFAQKGFAIMFVINRKNVAQLMQCFSKKDSGKIIPEYNSGSYPFYGQGQNIRGVLLC